MGAAEGAGRDERRGPMPAQPREQPGRGSREIAYEIVVIDASAIAQAGGAGGLERIHANHGADSELAGELAHDPGARTEIEQHDLCRVDPKPGEGAREPVGCGLRRAALQEVLDDMFVEPGDAVYAFVVVEMHDLLVRECAA